MPAPYGRVMSGRGFAPNGFEAYDLPAAGQYNRDLPDLGAKASTDAWLQQAKMTKNLQGMHKRTNPNHIPSVMQGQAGQQGFVVNQWFLQRTFAIVAR